MVYQGATGLYHFVINVIPFISNSVGIDTPLHYIQLITNTKIFNKYCVNSKFVYKNLPSIVKAIYIYE